MSASVRSGLYRDPWFWAAMVAGPLLCYSLYRLFAIETTAAGLPDWRTLLWLILLIPMLEEWLFRGLLQALLLRWWPARLSLLGFTVANILTTLLFVLAHLLKYPSAWALTVAIPSLLFGWFRDRYRSILPGSVLHSSYNLEYIWLFGTP